MTVLQFLCRDNKDVEFEFEFMNNTASRASVKRENAPIDSPIDDHSFMYNVGDNPDFELQLLQELFGLQQANNSDYMYQVSSMSTDLQMSGQDSSCILNSQTSMFLDSRHQETSNDATEIPQWSYCIQKNETSSFQDYESQFHIDRTVLPHSNGVEQLPKKPVIQQMLLHIETHSI